jgi:hypothetical protein
MTISMYEASVPVFRRLLANLAGILERAEAWAGERGIEERVLLEARLYPDMFPLVRQVQIAADVATRAVARLADREVSRVEDNETSLAELVARLQGAVAYLDGFEPAEFDDAETRPVSLELRGRTVHFEGLPYLLNFVTPNVYFHVTTAYDILRHNGLEIGKRDFLGDIFG